MSEASPLVERGAQDERDAGAQGRSDGRRRGVGLRISAWAICAGATAMSVQAAGCFPLSYKEDCKENPIYCPDDGVGGRQEDPSCQADPTEGPSTVRDECAVFASAKAAPGGNGTKATPYASLAEAISKAGGKRVLACTGGTFAESVTITAGVEVIGGFNCDADWAFSDGARSTLAGLADQAALTLSDAASGARVRNFSITAANATVPGGSSIGVAVADIEAELAHVDVTAGDAMDGANGKLPPGTARSGENAPGTGSDACVAPGGVFGGDPGAATCDDGGASGGRGGIGGITTEMGDRNGQKGDDGTPLPDPNPTNKGIGGAGQSGTSDGCAPGAAGRNGDLGTPGAGGSGTLLTLTGVTGGDGRDGGPGTRGQGGGGGGGAMAGVFCRGPMMSTIDGVGASGGGGGGGGCGGKGGGGGKAGGSSVAILSLGSRLALTDVTATAGKAGNGGSGVPGASGGDGGRGAQGGLAGTSGPSIRGCSGGDGGQGGGGGFGGGGRGGHAVGIAYNAAPGEAGLLKDFAGGQAGLGGAVATGGPDDSKGKPGVIGACWNFATGTSCAP